MYMYTYDTRTDLKEWVGRHHPRYTAQRAGKERRKKNRNTIRALFNRCFVEQVAAVFAAGCKTGRRPRRRTTACPQLTPYPRELCQCHIYLLSVPPVLLLPPLLGARSGIS